MGDFIDRRAAEQKLAEEKAQAELDKHKAQSTIQFQSSEPSDPNGILPQPNPQVRPEQRFDLPINKEQTETFDEIRRQLNLPTSVWDQREEGLSTLPPANAMQNLVRALASSDDPMAEINRIKAAEFLGERLKIPTGSAYANLDRLSEIFMGKVMPAPTFLEGVRNHWQNGVTTWEINELGNKLAQGIGDRAALMQQVQQMRQKLIPIKDVPKFFALKWLDTIIDSAPQMLESMLYGGTMGLATGATAGAMLGAVGAPLTAGLSSAAMASAMGSVGLVVGTTQALATNMRGGEYLRMIDAGVPHNVASTVSLISGYVQGALESAGELLVGLPFVPFASIGERIAGKILLTNFGLKLAVDMGTKVLAAGAGEGIENSLQYATQTVMDQLAIEIAKDPTVKLDKPSAEAFIKEFGNQFYQGFGAGILFGVMGIPKGVKVDVKQMGAIKRLAMIMPDSESFVKAVEEAKIGEVPVSSEAWKGYLRKVYARQQEIINAELEKRNAQEGKTPAAAAGTSDVVPAPIETRLEPEGTGPEGPRSILVAGRAEGQERHAFIRYSTQANTITVNEVVNEPGYSLDRQLLIDLMQRNPGKVIEWAPDTEEQLALRDELIAKNPLGAQAGLNWYAQGQSIAEQAVNLESLTQAFKKRFGMNEDQAEYFAVLAESRARKKRIPVNEWLASRVKPGVIEESPRVRAAMEKIDPATGLPSVAATTFQTGEGRMVDPLELNEEGLRSQVRAAFSAMEGADFHHAVHEFFHMIERLDLDPEEIRLFELALGRPRAMWTVAHLERLATMFEEYLATGKGPTPELTSIFQRIAQIFRDLVSYMRGKDKLTPEFIKAYDALFAVPEGGLYQAGEVEVRAAEFPVMTPNDLYEANGMDALVDMHQAEIEAAMEGPVEVETKNGPDPDDPVGLPPALYHVRDVPGWEAQVAAYMKNGGFTPEETKAKIRAIHGQMKIFNALGPHEIEFFPEGTHEITHKFPRLGMKKGAGTSEFAGFGPIRGNADPIYRVTFDASAMCPKRLAAAATQLWVQGKLNRTLTASERIALVALFKMNGKTAPCIYCYVESPRGKAGEFVGRAHAIVTGEMGIPKNWSAKSKSEAKAAQAAYKKNPVELDPNIYIDPAYTSSPDAQEKIEESPEIYQFIKGQYNAAKSNIPKLYEAYDAHILHTPNSLIDELNNYAGFRFFSSSDFQLEHIVDLVQAFNDLTAKKAKSHSYTKVIDFIRIFGATGQKINTSVFAKEENGQIIEDAWQGMAWEDAKKAREQFPDVGTILVATSDAIVEWGLDQPWIDYIIPFHYSGLEKRFYETLDWADFTSSQKEQWAVDPKTGKRPKKGKVKQIRMYELKTSEGVSNRDLTQRYLEMCRQRGLEPVFSKWMNHPEFGKLKKDYARTDTPFNITDGSKIDMKEVSAALQKLFAGESPRGVADTIVGDQLLQKIWEFEDRPDEDIGQEALKGVQYGTTAPQHVREGYQDPTAVKALFHAAPKDVAKFNKQALKIFGTTEDPSYGAWILSTGEMLNFRGTTLDYFGNMTTTRKPHKFIEEAFRGTSSEGMTAYEGAWEMGALRMDFPADDLVLEGTVMANEAQQKTLAKFITSAKMLYTEIRGENPAYKDISRPTIQKLQDFYTAQDYYSIKDIHLLRHADERKKLDSMTRFGAEGWVLKSEEVIMAKMRGPMQTGALKAMLLKNGVKPEEMKWMGLDDFLSGDRRVSPEEVMTFLENNGIRLMETVYRNQIRPTRESLIKEGYLADYDVKKKAWAILDTYGNQVVAYVAKTEQKAWEMAIVEEDLNRQDSNSPKFPQYRTTGGENYREIVVSLTAPTKEARGRSFYGAHWEEPDVVAHARVADFPDAGGKALLVEEIQSDWHETGRTSGYMPTGPIKGYRVVMEDGSQGGLAGFFKTREEAEEANRTIPGFYGKTKVVEDDISPEEQVNQGNEGEELPPVGPFSKTWHEMMFRRVLLEAVHGGYSKLALTTGKAQSDRYGKTKVYKSIAWAINDSGEYWVRAHTWRDKDEWVLLGAGLKAEEVAKVVGEEAATAILSGQGDMLMNGFREILMQVNIPSKGMVGFYDKMLVDYANKFGKKFNARMEDGTIGGHKNTTEYRVVKIEWGGIPQFIVESRESPDVAWRSAERPGASAMYDTEDAAKERIRIFKKGNSRYPKVEVHIMPITPEMRDSVSKSVGLFHPADFGPVYSDLIASAKNYASLEEFRAAMEEIFGVGAPGAIEAYMKIWNAAHPEVTEPPPEVAELEKKPEIPLPEKTGELLYDFDDKTAAAQNISNPDLAAKVGMGEFTDYDIDEEIARNFGAEQEAREALIAAEADKPNLTPEEAAFVQDAENLAKIPGETRSPTAKEYSRRLIRRLTTALKRNAALVEMLDDAKEVAKQDLVWQKAISDAQAELKEIEARQRKQELKEIFNKAITNVKQNAADEKRRLRTKMYAERRAAMAKFRDQTRTAMADRAALLKAKEARKKLLQAIMEPVSIGVAFKGYADRIKLIQRQIDPRSHRAATLEERQASQEFFKQNPDAAALVPKKTLDLIYSIPSQKLTLAQLEEVYELIEGLKKLGKLKRSLQLEQRARKRTSLQNAMVTAILRGEPLEKVIGAAKGTPAALRAYLLGLKPGRVAQLLDGIFAGVTGKGPFWQVLQEMPNAAWNAMTKVIDRRQESVISQLDRLKVTLDPLSLKRAKGYTYVGESVDIEGFRYSDGKKPTWDDIMYWYLGVKNEKTKAALLHGNNIPQEVLDKGIKMLPNNLKAVADLISQDFEANFERYRDAFIANFNEDLPKEQNYVTMNRKEISYKTREEKVAAELTGRSGMTKHYVDRGSTHARIEISDEHQKPIATNLMSVWTEAVRDQEGFIHQDMMIKDMHSILGADQVKAAIQQKYGPAMNEWLRHYINDLAQDESYASQLAVEKWSRIARSNAAVAWLSFNLLSATKQFIGWINALADAGPLRLASAAAQYAAAQGKSLLKGQPFNNSLIDFVKERSQLVKHRQISQEFEDLRRLNKPGYEQLVKKVGALGMKALEMMDMMSVTIGWKAVYDRAMAEGATEAEAIKTADEATVRTQPSMRVQDMAEMYRAGEALKWFTMFTSDLNSSYNRMAFDVPAALRNGQILHALADMLTFALAGVWITIASGAFRGSDDEKKKKRVVLGIFSQYFEALPFLGQDVFTAIQMAAGTGKAFQSGGVKLFPAITYVQSIPKEIVKGEWDKALVNLAEAAGFAVGLPVSGTRRAVKAATTGDWEALLGWPAEKKE